MTDPTPPESPHERLNRELARLQVRSVGFWGGWAVLIGTLGAFAFFALNTPSDARFVRGVAGDAQQILREDGAYVLLRVEVEGVLRDLRLPSALVHPEPGAAVCLQAGTRRLTGGTRYILVPDSRCEGPTATPEVE